MAEPLKPIHTSPKTDSQLRSILNRLQRGQTTLVADLGSLEDRFLRQGTAGVAVAAGNVLYAPSSGSVSPARANTALTSIVVGVALNGAAPAANVVYLTIGAVTLSALSAGVVYYLSAVTPGAIVSTPDAVAGQYIVPVGKALTTTELLFLPLTSVLL